MRAPEHQRNDDAEIVAEILTLLKPPADRREATRIKVLKDIGWLKAYTRKARGLPSPSSGRFKQQSADYLKNLRATKRTFVRWPSWTEEQERKRFLASLDREIDRVKDKHDDISVGKGHRPLDQVARAATERAAEYFSPEQRKLTANGPWHRLAVLFYRIATGEDRDLMHVLRKFDRKTEIVRRRLIPPSHR